MTNQNNSSDRFCDGSPCGYQVDDARIEELLRREMSYLSDGIIPQPHYDLAALLYELKERRATVEPRALLSDRADDLIRELHRQGMVTMQSVFDGAILKIQPDREGLPNGLAVKSSDIQSCNCGYDSPRTALFCSHCGVTLPAYYAERT